MGVSGLGFRVSGDKRAQDVWIPKPCFARSRNANLEPAGKLAVSFGGVLESSGSSYISVLKTVYIYIYIYIYLY